MSDDRAVDNDEFREALKPLVCDLTIFSDAVQTVGDRYGGIATVDSAAMREIADESPYADASGWTGPIRDTYALGGLTLFAAADYVRNFAQAFTGERPSVYGHLVAARGALESSVAASWLNEPDIARDDRVKRGLSEFLYSAVEEERLDLHPDAAAHVDEWVDRATKLGWAATDHNGGSIGPLLAGLGAEEAAIRKALERHHGPERPPAAPGSS
jgi:hypothetical protein